MVIFPLAPDQTIAEMWSNGARGRTKLLSHLPKNHRILSFIKYQTLPAKCMLASL